MKTARRKIRKAFLLLEVVLALTVFSMAATGFVVALQRMSKAASLAQEEMRVTRLLETTLNETLSLSVLEPGETSQLVEEGKVEMITVIELLDDLENEEGLPLEEMYRIRLTARWYENGQWQEREVETWRYGRLYQPS